MTTAGSLVNATSPALAARTRTMGEQIAPHVCHFTGVQHFPLREQHVVWLAARPFDLNVDFFLAALTPQVVRPLNMDVVDL